MNTKFEIEAIDKIKEIKPSWVQSYLEKILPDVISLAIEVVLALIILLIGSKLIKWVVRLVKKSMNKSLMEPGVTTFLSSVVKYALYAVLVMIILSQFGVTASSIVAVLGSAGLAIGLSVQGSLSNFAGGVLILLLKPFVVGDYILEKSTNLEGTVDSITIFYTVLRTPDNKEIFIPNGNLSNTSIINMTRNVKRRVDVQVSVAYDSDLKLVKETLLNVVRSEELILQDEPIDVFVSELGASGILMQVRAWAANENFWNALWNLREQTKLDLDDANIEIPYNRIDISMKTQA